MLSLMYHMVFSNPRGAIDTVVSSAAETILDNLLIPAILNIMETKIDKWVITLSRIPVYEEDTEVGMRLSGRMYEVTDVSLNGETLRCASATLVMQADTPISLHLEIMPRDLEIVMEDASG